MPFREAHAVVGQLVRRHLAGDGGLADLARTEVLGPDAAALVRPGSRRACSAPRRVALAPVRSALQLDRYRSMLDGRSDAGSTNCQSRLNGG